MDKYQEALQYIHLRAIELGFIKDDIKILEKSSEAVNILQELVDLTKNQFENPDVMNIKNEYGRALTILQNHCLVKEDTKWASSKIMELVDKETPKKPIRHTNSFYRCENCEELFQNHHYQNHCSNCGQALDWSE